MGVASINKKGNADQNNGAPASGLTGAAAPLESLLGTFARSSGLGENARAYLDRLKAIWSDNNSEIELYAVQTANFEGRIVVHVPSRNALLLIFKETNVSGDQYPISAYTVAGWNARNTIEGLSDIIPLETIVVSSEDYPCVDKMAAFIMNVFNGQIVQNQGKFTVQTYGNSKFQVTSNLSQALSFYQSINPHGVPVRADFGLLISMEVPGEPGFGYGPRNYETKPFAVVLGYNNVLFSQSGALMYMPTITDVMARIPNFNVLNLVMPLAVDHLFPRGGAAASFLKFDKNGPNLGKLYVNDEGKLGFFQTPGEVINFIRGAFMPPVLAIDISEGRARIPGIDDFVANPTKVLQNIETFAGRQPGTYSSKDSGVTVSGGIFPAYTGTVMLNGKEVDSRTIDYLQITAGASVESDEQKSRFLSLPNDPQAHASNLQFVGYSLNPLYVTHRVLLHASVIRAFANSLEGANNIVVNYDRGNETGANIDQLATDKDLANYGAVGGFGIASQGPNLGRMMSYYSGL